MPEPAPNLLALAAEVDGLARRLDEMYQVLRPAYPYAWSTALDLRGRLEGLAEQLRDDALDAHPDAQRSAGQ